MSVSVRYAVHKNGVTYRPYTRCRIVTGPTTGHWLNDGVGEYVEVGSILYYPEYRAVYLRIIEGPEEASEIMIPADNFELIWLSDEP